MAVLDGSIPFKETLFAITKKNANVIQNAKNGRELFLPLIDKYFNV
jgi:hypothetical protein